jgi:tRNA threonylcarbamoyladenosine biosynthesis protein TsaE
MLETKYLTKTPEDIEKVANKILQETFTSQKNVVGLYGDLGSGKTTFVQSLAKLLGVEGGVNSPTFVIEKIYDLPEEQGLGNKRFSHLIHIDAYRLEKAEELLHLGWREIISNKNNLVLIEWPEKVLEIMPDHVKIYFKHGKDENEREIEIVG